MTLLTASNQIDYITQHSWVHLHGTTICGKIQGNDEFGKYYCHGNPNSCLSNVQSRPSECY